MWWSLWHGLGGCKVLVSVFVSKKVKVFISASRLEFSMELKKRAASRLGVDILFMVGGGFVLLW
jgi:hypothetical protein